MSNNYDDYGYEDSSNNNKSGLWKKLIIVLLVVIAIFIIIYLINGCSKKETGGGEEIPVTFDYEKALLKAGKMYYENNTDEYPTTIGECTQVELQSLSDKGLLDSSQFEGCNLESTFVRVCILSNGSKQFTPWITCEGYKSDEKYDSSKEGTINDVIADSTYVDFKFLPQVVSGGDDKLGEVEELWKSEITYPSYKTISTTKYYRYRDKLFTWDVTTKKYYTSTGEKTKVADVKEYYPVAPNSNYNLYDSKTTEAYKWYTTTSTKVYALGENGEKALSATPIGDYTLNEEGAIVNRYRTRTVLSTYTPNKFYVCSTNATSTILVYQPKECGKGSNPTYTYQRDIVYSCASTTGTGESVIANIVKSTDKCYNYSDWSKTTSTPCDTALNTCQKVSMTFYFWYKLADNGVKKYYPSGASTAAGEKIYYTSAPVKNAVKDTTTKSTAYKWYKATTKTTTEYTALAPSGYSSTSKTSDYKWTDWSNWSKTNPKKSDGRVRSIETKTKIKLRQILGTTGDSWENLANNDAYLTEEEMIKLFNDSKYNVKSLLDITNNGEIRYQVKMYLRNKREAN